jgi:hypothetical protein
VSKLSSKSRALPSTLVLCHQCSKWRQAAVASIGRQWSALTQRRSIGEFFLKETAWQPLSLHVWQHALVLEATSEVASALAGSRSSTCAHRTHRRQSRGRALLQLPNLSVRAAHDLLPHTLTTLVPTPRTLQHTRHAQTGRRVGRRNLTVMKRDWQHTSACVGWYTVRW